eukprot:TRINITY_DN2260_c0_g1_i2.p1 TRINITY_DN2260_c0_g1~~TRINITY_DN2260_c0_g1_i2.p1  ORF type:complete len:382 (+),score=102.72 TRINITY_DN2260_c0_g1_i2:22-1146(+)
MNGKQKMGICLLVFGFAAIAAGILVNMQFVMQAEEGFKDAATLKKGSDTYKAYVADRTSNSKFYLWNITNPAAVQAGAKAELAQVGPYVYTAKTQTLNPTFNDKGTQLSFRTQSVYAFNASESKGSKDDEVYVMNTSWLGALALTGSESNLMVAFVGGTLSALFGQIETAFIPGFYIGATATTLNSTMASFSSGFRPYVQAGIVYNAFLAATGITTNATLYTENNATESVKADLFFNNAMYWKTLVPGRNLTGPNSSPTGAIGYVPLAAQKNILYGVGPLPGWLSKPQGAGIGDFLATATTNATLTAPAYGLTVPQYQGLLGYIQAYLLRYVVTSAIYSPLCLLSVVHPVCLGLFFFFLDFTYLEKPLQLDPFF